MSTTTRNFPPGNLRVSDADRDRAVSELSEHFQAGRLTAGELEERSGLALRARTGDDLSALLADLPQDQRARTPGPPDPGHVAPMVPGHTPVAGIAVAALVILVVMAIFSTAGHPGGHYWVGLVPLLVAALIVRRVVRGGPGHEHLRSRDRDRLR